MAFTARVDDWSVGMRSASYSVGKADEGVMKKQIEVKAVSRTSVFVSVSSNLLTPTDRQF